MPVLTMPSTPRFAPPSTWRPITNTLSHVSRLDRTTQTLEFPGAHWACDYVLPTMLEDRGVDWATFLDELDGPAGRFYATHPYHLAPRGSAKDTPGTPVVAGASQTGKALAISGAPASAAGYLLRGDYWSVDLPSGGRSMHRIVADVNTNGAGAATLTFRPALRESPADAAAIQLAPASCIMRLVDDNQAADVIDHLGHYSVSFSAIEAFLI